MPLIDPPVTPDLPARQRLLLTASQLFYREGIRATGIDRVIAESGVTKVTFYRHFPSKNDLICAYLAQRHERWMAWFDDALQRHDAIPGLGAVHAALVEWLQSEEFHGCAFLNSVSELGSALPEVVDITRRHKADMTRSISARLSPAPDREQRAQAAALAVDGAIVQAQFADSPAQALSGLATVLQALEHGPR